MRTVVADLTSPDIDATCRGVNLDSTRLKDCLYRNQDTTSAQCKADYPRALDAIQKHIAARANVGRQCEYEIVKKCSGKAKEAPKALPCLLGISNLTARCSQAIGDAEFCVANSNHPGGVNTLTGDGSVKFLKDSINQMTYWALGTRARGEVIDASAY